MPLTRADPSTRTLDVNADKLTVRSVISTIDPDRAGDIVIPTGIQNADDYLLNPIVLWAHNRSRFPPIGVCEWLDVQPRRIVAQTRFARGVPFAEDVFRLYEQGVLRGWSIGFVPRQAKRELRRDGSTGLRVQTWDLLEYSAVPIPENPDAVTVAIEKGYVRDPYLLELLLESASNDVLGELLEPLELRHSE